jgi:hypothetical protein
MTTDNQGQAVSPRTTLYIVIGSASRRVCQIREDILLFLIFLIVIAMDNCGLAPVLIIYISEKLQVRTRDILFDIQDTGGMFN